MPNNRYQARGAFSLSLLVLSLVLMGTSTEALAQDRTALLARYEQLTSEFRTAQALHERSATPTTKVTLERTLRALNDFKVANQAALGNAQVDRRAGTFPFVQKTEPRVGAPQGMTKTYASGPVGDPISETLPPTTSTISITDGGEITDVHVNIDISHTFGGDLDLVLESPSGTPILLLGVFSCAGIGDIVTTFDDVDGTAFCPPSSPIVTDHLLGIDGVGLGNFNGENLEGDWTLTVADLLGGDEGTLNNWSLEIAFDAIDLELDKTCEVNGNGTGTYSLTLSNTSPDDATGVRVQDWLPGLIGDVDGDPSQGTFNNGSGVWIVGDLDAGDAATLDIDFTFDIDVSGQYLNHAEVVAADETDIDSTPDDGEGDDYAECGFIVLPDRTVADFVPEAGAGGVTERGRRFEADLEVTKDVDKETAQAGDEVTYTITVGNNGPHSTSKVALADKLPGCLDFVSATADQGSYNDSLGVWTVGAVKVDEERTLTIVAKVTDACDGEVVNTAYVSASNLPDPQVSPKDPDAPLEGPFEERETKRNNKDEAAFTVESGSGRVLDGTTFALGNNYPNPFNPTTMVPFSLAEASPVSIKVYDMLGREVAVLVDGAMSAGVHEVAFEASALPTGVYLIRMEAAGIVQIQRVTLMK